ncbi:thioredoxin-like protein [Pyronema omphalodes]|nr:thioredoxin-like protein [Pyronema omphalodes]
MRFGSPYSLLLAVLAGQSVFSGVLAAGQADKAGDTVVADAHTDPKTPESPAKAADALPEVLQLTGGNFKEKIAKGYWIVKHHSPQCPHCIAVAPTWKKVVNHYTTTPVSPDLGATYTQAYPLNFGDLDCLAYGDTCAEFGVVSWPWFNVFKDGKKVDSFDKTERTFETLSAFVDKQIDEIKSNKVDKAKKKAVPAVVATPNPTGESLPLDTERFTKLITTTRDAWLVKFYAPWCGHCQAMAPAWAELGKEMKGELNIGEVNCEAEKRLCKDLKIKGYPTILYFQNGERVEYDGLRGMGDLVSYARKAVDSGVKEITDEEFKALEKKGDMEVAFVYFYDHAAVSEDFAALDRLTLNLIGRAPIYKTKDPLMSTRFRIFAWPKLMVVREGRPSYYNALAPHDMRDYGRVLNWMKSVWLPIVPELTAANSHQIMNNHIVVLGILNREKADDFTLAKKELKEAAMEFMTQRAEEETAERKRLRDAKQLRLEEAEDRNDDRAIKAAKNTRIDVSRKKEVHFAWVDGIFWERWVRTTYGVNVKEDGARIIINDEDHKLYWDTNTEGGPITPSRSRILATLNDVLSKSPSIPAKSTSSTIERIFLWFKSGSNGHPWVAIIFFVIAILGLAFWGRGRIRRKAAGYFRLDGKEGILGGLGVGGPAGGKVD